MSEPIRIADREFQARRVTGAGLLERAGLEDEIGDAIDAVNAIAVELEHAEGRLFALAEIDSEEFDTSRREGLLEQRRALRREHSSAQVTLFRLRLQAIARRLEPEPDVEFLLSEVEEGSLQELVAEINAARPTRSAPPADESASS